MDDGVVEDGPKNDGLIEDDAPRFATALATVVLERRPPAPNLQAFDHADAFLLREFAGLEQPEIRRVLVVNDTFGAVAVSLAAFSDQLAIDSYTDSAVSAAALHRNLDLNDLPASGINIVHDERELVGPYDVVLMRVPKSLGLFEFQLRQVHSLINTATPVFAAAMAKHLPGSARQLMIDVLGSGDGSLTEQRARCIRSLVHPNAPAPRSLRAITQEFRHASPELTVGSFPGVFGGARLDPGSAMLVAHLPEIEPGERVLDLGAGNGPIGIAVGVLHADAALTFIDESYLAVEAARHNWAANLGVRDAEFMVHDGIPEDLVGIDHIVCNPPFHQHHVVGDDIAWTMFLQARRAVRKGGTFTVVGNRHLGYHSKLKRLFGNVSVVASSPKFVVVRSVR